MIYAWHGAPDATLVTILVVQPTLWAAFRHIWSNQCFAKHLITSLQDPLGRNEFVSLLLKIILQAIFSICSHEFVETLVLFLLICSTLKDE